MDTAKVPLILFVCGLLLLFATPVYGFVTKPPFDTSMGTGNSTAGDTIITGTQYENVVRTDGNTTQALNPPDGTTYFSVTPRGDGILTSYAAKSATCEYNTTCSGFRKVYLSNRTTAWKWTFQIPKIGRSEVHDVEPLGNGKFVFTDMVHERIAIYDKSADTITWEWRGEQHYNNPPENYTTGDWLHINDVDRLPDGRFMVSVREKSQILFIDKQNGVTGVINKNRNHDILFEQHNPQWLGPGAVLVADSENDRIVELHKEGSDWQVAGTVYSADGIAFQWPRDVDRLPNGHTLITDSRNNRIVELSANKSVVNTWKVSGTPYEADLLRYGDEINSAALPTASEGGNVTVQSTYVPRYADLLHAGIVEVAEGIPYWFNPIHVFMMSIGVVLVLLSLVTTGIQQLSSLGGRR